MAAIKVATDVAGRVWQVVANAGDALNPDDPIVVIECMKMEIPVMAPRAGKVSRVLVKEGDAVREGQVVAEME
jgi:acetyl-CoA carboxylase biotin carboxyl carrier protein